jgi:predicted AAA+ superfamily ATPase
MSKLIKRPIYIDKIKKFINDDVVKILIGIRRSGKSELLKLIMNEILKLADKQHLIYINFESADFFDIDNYQKLSKCISKLMIDEKKYYILLDEIQHVEH